MGEEFELLNGSFKIGTIDDGEFKEIGTIDTTTSFEITEISEEAMEMAGYKRVDTSLDEICVRQTMDISKDTLKALIGQKEGQSKRDYALETLKQEGLTMTIDITFTHLPSIGVAVKLAHITDDAEPIVVFEVIESGNFISMPLSYVENHLGYIE